MILRRIAPSRIVFGFVTVALVASLLSIPALNVEAENARLVDGTSIETLASVSLAEWNGSRMVLMHLTLDPGTTIRAHSHSGPAVLTVISGALQSELLRGEANVNRDGIEEPAELGATTYLYGGESISFAPLAGATIANDSDEPLLLVASMLLKPNEPMFDFDFWIPPSRPNLQ